jgi:hemerythrin superfamily protein
MARARKQTAGRNAARRNVRRKATARKTGARKTAKKTARKRAAPMATVVRKRVRRAARSVTRTATRATTQARRALRPARRGRAPLARSAHEDAVTLLKEDHKQLRKLLDELKSANTDDRRARLFHQVEEALKTHTRIEEEIFYPAFRDVAMTKRDRQLFHEAIEEHHAADTILPEVGNVRAEPDVFAARAKVLKEVVEHHAEEEETEMFPRARKLLPASELRRLGTEMAARKRSLQSAKGPLSAVTSLFSS